MSEASDKPRAITVPNIIVAIARRRNRRSAGGGMELTFGGNPKH
jgi:hypothetical protein